MTSAGGSRPSAATAIAAATLVVLIGLWHVVGVVGAFTADSSGIELIVGIGLNAVIAGVALSAGVAVFMRKPAGRVLCGVACALAMGMYVFRALRTGGGLAAGNETTALVIVAVPAVLGAVFAVLPSTGRWLAWGKPQVPKPSYRPRQRPR